ncbi:MAG: hypothetical protein ABIF77_18930 [bacterium]
MSHPMAQPVHTFHIPVMGTGFTIDTPLKVARYGISSVVSLVDDTLIEQMRALICQRHNQPYVAIEKDEEDARARRITAYLDLLEQLIQEQMVQLRNSVFEAGSEITRYYEMLPQSPLRGLYENMLATTDPAARNALQEKLRGLVRPGAVDVNIMTKLDRERFRQGELLGPRFTDAMSALRGYASSRLQSSVILSAGMNQKLFKYVGEFPDFFPDEAGDIRKRIVLKVSDFRSAMIQGKLLARLGLWVSEYRIESGLNCGGHAFGGKGHLLGPILEEFKREKTRLGENLGNACRKAFETVGRMPWPRLPQIRVTVQGGIGTAEEDAMLREFYGVDGTGWASPFLLCPEAVNIDAEHVSKLCAAGVQDVYLSESSPLGVPFWSLRTSASETTRQELIARGTPGSACPKGFLSSDTEFTKLPICTASRAYQKRKLAQLEQSDLSAEERAERREQIIAKACICHDLAGSATVPHQIDPDAHTAVCCGPNTVYFDRAASLQQMIDHIYGRSPLPLASNRPHMLLQELSLHIERLQESAAKHRRGLMEATADSAAEIRTNLQAGIAHYREQASRIASIQKPDFTGRLDKLRLELERIISGLGGG